MKMVMKIIPHLILMMIVISCTARRSTETLAGCYRMIIKKDTATLSLNAEGSKITGSLSYHWFEKDHNDGTFDGEIMNDSLLVADYTFQSEGNTSVRQVVFKIRDSLLLQGYGELIEKNDTSFLRDVKLAIFDTKNPFRKGCD